MGHNIAQTKNGKWMTAWTGDTPWHHLGQQSEGLMTATEALAAAHLDWEVTKLPLEYKGSDDLYDVIPDTYGVFRVDEDGEYIPLTRSTAVGRVWKPFQNVEAFSFLDDLTNTLEAKIEVCGALGNGEKVWVLAKLPESIVIDNADVVDQYILIVNSHDGSGSVKIFLTPVRVVCNNTLTLALSKRSGGYNIRHTGKLHGRVDEAREALGMINKDFYEWGEQAASLLDIDLTEHQMEMYFIDALDLTHNKEGNLTTRSQNLLNTVKSNLNNTTNKVGSMAGTAWAAYNALTEAIDHQFTKLANGEKSQKRMESALFGTFARKKGKAFELALNSYDYPMLLEELLDVGA